MKKKINIKYQLLACILMFSASSITAQTGVLTHNPAQLLHIDGAKDNAATVTAAQAANDVVATAAGNLGVGVLNPMTRVDLRSADQKGIIGIGTNTQTAGAAGAGALRYNTTSTFLEYSDGSIWIPWPNAVPPKALVNAVKNSVQTITTGITNPTPANNFISNWNVSIDTGGNFAAGTGTFTAPRAGFYLVSFSITLASADIPNNRYIETAIERTTGTSTTIPKFVTVNSYPAYQFNVVGNFISGNCNGIFNLNAGETIRFSVKHNMGSNRSILNDGTLNNLSISEL